MKYNIGFIIKMLIGLGATAGWVIPIFVMTTYTDQQKMFIEFCKMLAGGMIGHATGIYYNAQDKKPDIKEFTDVQKP